MNRLALLALFLGIALGLALLTLGWASPLTRLVAAGSIASTLTLLLLLLIAALRLLPRRGRMILALCAAPLVLRGVYFLVRFHWLSPGLFLGALVLGIVLLWRVKPRVAALSRRNGAALAALCGLGVPLLWSGFAPRDLLHGVKRWRSEPSTRTPLGIAAHTGLLGGLGLLPLLGIASLRSGSDENAPA